MDSGRNRLGRGAKAQPGDIDEQYRRLRSLRDGGASQEELASAIGSVSVSGAAHWVMLKEQAEQQAEEESLGAHQTQVRESVTVLMAGRSAQQRQERVNAILAGRINEMGRFMQKLEDLFGRGYSEYRPTLEFDNQDQVDDFFALLNEYIGALPVLHFNNSLRKVIDVPIDSLMNHAEKLRSVLLTDIHFSSEQWEQFPALTELEVLSVFEGSLPHDAWSHIAAIPSLDTLSVFANHLPDGALEALASAPRLRRLRLANMDVPWDSGPLPSGPVNRVEKNAFSLAPLASLASLRELDLIYHTLPFTDELQAEMLALEGLTRVDMTVDFGGPTDDAEMLRRLHQFVGQHPTLRYFSFVSVDRPPNGGLGRAAEVTFRDVPFPGARGADESLDEPEDSRGVS